MIRALDGPGAPLSRSPLPMTLLLAGCPLITDDDIKTRCEWFDRDSTDSDDPANPDSPDTDPDTDHPAPEELELSDAEHVISGYDDADRSADGGCAGSGWAGPSGARRGRLPGRAWAHSSVGSEAHRTAQVFGLAHRPRQREISRYLPSSSRVGAAHTGVMVQDRPHPHAHGPRD